MRLVSDRDDDDWDEADEFDPDHDDDDDPTVPCPHCHWPAYDDAERCPACGAYLSREDEPWRPKPAWIVMGVCICLAIVYRWIFFLG